MTNRERVLKIISSHMCCTEEEVLTTEFEDLGLDSLDQMEIIMGLEEEFDVKMDYYYIEDFPNVNSIFTFLEKMKL